MSTPDHKPDSADKISHFIRHVIEADLQSGKYASRHWSGKPGPSKDSSVGAGALHGGMSAPPSARTVSNLDSAKIRTRFPPEPNGYLHFGHAKSICLNFGLAADYAGACHLRFDDTNPEKEEQEYVDSIIDAVKWLGFEWQFGSENNEYFASSYFQWMYEFAEKLIVAGLAYVDSQSADEMRASRGTLTEGGKNSPFRDRTVAENLDLFRRMKAGEFADGTHILRAKIDMNSGNINMRDPAIYRIRHATHHATGNDWCIYPMYTYAHPIEDALENITHSICTLEFEDQRPFYNWLLGHLAELSCINTPPPQQIEFARLNLTYMVLSKRKLIQLVDEKHVDGWDDPRMPTLVGARRRGYTAAGFRRFMEMIGVAKNHQLIDISVLEECIRDDLNDTAPRRTAVLDPVKLIIDNYPAGHEEKCLAPNHPQKPEWGKRAVPFSGELWIEREDFMETPGKGYFRLFPGNRVRLRYGFVIECTGCDKDADGTITAVHCNYLADSKSGTPGSDNYKVKGNIHWLSARHSLAVSVRLYDRLFAVANPGEGDADFITELNPNSLTTITAQVEPSLGNSVAEDHFQFERHGYFVADRIDSKPGAPVFNRAVTLKDAWAKATK
ncbi:MAG: glutamine--tRNA ligase/YqeY domain fusion protein [Rhodocyclaceae bacterium]|nr:glutamine--tRNA ligase/YqeY domain fusion protein [Rhodocyclaceae bacterium]